MKSNRCEHFRETICLSASGALPEPEKIEGANLDAGTGGWKPPELAARMAALRSAGFQPASSGLFQSPVEIHLAACAECRKYYDEIRSLAAPLAKWERNFSHVEPAQALQTRWANAIKSADKPKSFSPISQAIRTLWLELIWPCRRAWTGMAAIWLLLLVINSGLSRGEEKRFTDNSASAPAIAQRMEEERKLLAELIPPANPQPAEPPRRNHPQPRSEKHVATLAA